MAALSACGGGGAPPADAPAAEEGDADVTLSGDELTLTPEEAEQGFDPRLVPTAIPAGHPDNPVAMVIVAPAGSRSEAETAAERLAEFLRWYGAPNPEEATTPEAEETEASATPTPEEETPAGETTPEFTPELTMEPQPVYAIQVELVENYAAVIERLCDSEAPAAGWVDAWSYLLMEERNCAVPHYIVETGRGSRASTADEQIAIIRNDTRWIGTQTGRLQNLSQLTLNNVTFCWLAEPRTWRLPALALMREDLNPLTDLGDELLEYDEVETLVRAVYEEECIAASVPVDWEDEIRALEREIEENNGTPLEEAIVEMQTSVAVPNAVLVYPHTVPLNIREHLNAALRAYLEDETGEGVLRLLVGADGLERVDGDDFDDFRASVEEADLDLMALGE